MAFIACSPTDSVISQFKRVDSRDAYGRFCFVADMSDTASTYAISLLSVFSCTDQRFGTLSSLPVSVACVSPDSVMYEGTFHLVRDSVCDNSYYEKIISISLGSGLVPVKPGLWSLYVKMPEDSLRKYRLEGIGLKIIKDGTR